MRTEPLSGGTPGRVERRGDVVVRRAGPWSPAVAALLGHLRRSGVAAVPAHLGFTGDGREVLTYVPGSTHCRPFPEEVRSDAALVHVGTVLRRLHTVAARHRPPVDARWQRLPGVPDGADTICHNDLGPWNVVLEGTRVAGVIDWDLAAPGPALFDVALAAWHWVPLYDDGDCAAFGWPSPPDRRSRLHRLAAAYGCAVDGTLLDLVARWHDVTRAAVAQAHADPGRPGADVWLKVDVAGVDRDEAFLATARSSLL